MVNKKRIAFIGFGQCGSNIVSIAEKRGYLSAIVNTSSDDLNSASVKSISNKLLLGSEGGAGKNRKSAQLDVKQNYEEFIKFFKSKVMNKNLKLVYLVFSL